MMHAILHGKAPPSLRRQEDILTSCVFGSLEHVGAGFALAPWLRLATNLVGEPLSISDHELEGAVPEFWPGFRLGDERVEPDVAFDLTDRLLVLEAKFGAGPSGWPTSEQGPLGGQLGRQWRAAWVSPRRGQRSLSLLYVTAGWSMPRGEMEAMILEVEREHPDEGEFRRSLYWLSWRALPACLRAATQISPDRDRNILNRLSRYLELSDLDTFEGVTIPASVKPPTWDYGYTTRPSTSIITWEYRK